MNPTTARFQPVPNEATLPLALARSRAYSAKRGSLSFQLEAPVAAALSGADGLAALVAAVACVLHRYTGERRLCVGTAAREGSPPVAVPVLVEVEPDLSLGSLLTAARAAIAESMQHAERLFAEVVAALGLSDVANRNPLFGVAVRDAATQAELPDTRCDLVLTFRERSLDADYSARLLRADTVERFCRHVAQTLQALGGAATRVAQVAYLDAGERRALLALGEGRPAALAAETVVALFARQAAATPDAPALLGGDTDECLWTYRELDRVSDRYAAALQARGARRGDRIGLCLRIGPEQVTWMLGVLKCGAVVVPIDVTFPRYRIEHIVRTSELGDVVAERALVDLLPSGTRSFLLEELEPPADGAPFQPQDVTGDDPIYLLYTSGSTGHPKGVLMRHRALANLVAWQNAETPAAGKRTLHRTSLTFDVSFQEVFSTWCFGGELVIADETQRGDISRWPDLLRRRRIARVFLPVIALHQFAELAADALPDLEHLIVAGEALRITPSVTRLFRVIRARLVNHYGPTETHVVTSYTLPEASATWPPLPPIGRPIQNARILILDASGQPVPIGVEGEIWIAGTPLAIGYHAQPALADERFRRVELDELPGERAYRTGDFGRFTPEGLVEFVGRRDEQVKLRGYRIELSEIETTLASIPGVRQGAAALWTDERGDARIAAYVVCAAASPSNHEIRAVLKERLPDYMVPSVANLMRVDALPLTATGKLDRRRLPRPAALDAPPESAATASPLASVADVVKSAWSSHLRTSFIDPLESFLDLGGHSLMAIQIVAEINERLGSAVPFAQLLRGPTLPRFTAVVERFVQGQVQPGDLDPDNVPVVRLPNGATVFAPYPPEVHYLYADIYEHRTYDQQGIRYDHGACIVDAGANVGLFTLYALARAPGSRVIAIEPAPQLWAQLRRNVAGHGERVAAVNVALGDRDHTGEFTYYPATPGMSSLHSDPDEERELLGAILRNLADAGQPEIRQLFAQEYHYLDQRLAAEKFPCRVRRLSDVCRELGVGSIDLLKIDVQKAELEVLRGIDEDDWPRVRQLVIEAHDLGGRLEQIVELLRGRGYAVRLGEQPPIHRNSVVRFVYATRSGGEAAA